MNPSIDFTVEETPQAERINNKGEYVFGIYTSNLCDEKLERTLVTMAKLWDIEDLDSDVNLTIEVRLRSLYESLIDLRADPEGVADGDSKHLFDALMTDCQWIIDQISKLKFQ